MHCAERINVVVFFLVFDVLLLPLCLAGTGEAQEDLVDFNHDIRPILSAACFTCHGPDENKREAGLRLDIRDTFTDVGSGNSIIVSGDPKRSELYLRLVHADQEQRMPPPESRNPLSSEQMEQIRKWIEQGAKWDEHWAFVSPKRPVIPEIERKNWPRGAIDHFILARLEQEGLSPSSEADRRTLSRRLTFDLTGLPPTPEEVEGFLTDGDHDAYEKLVDRLIASPRFGERLAVDWLDASRYADTHGYHEDYHRDMWPWRDWVIRSLNQNLPFDKFTTEQIAGDLLPGASNAQQVATGFSRNHGVTASGISEEYRVEYVIDRVKTTSAVFLGLTVGCAQCHDHKYDPISQRDFYRLFAYFNTITDKGVENRVGNVDPLVRVMDPMGQSGSAATEHRLRQIEKEMVTAADRSGDAFRDWLRRAAAESHETRVPRYGMVAHFRLAETDGDHTVDAVGGDAGVVRGKPLWVRNQYRRALRFDGQTHVDLGDIGDFDRLDAFSFGGWIYPSRQSILLARVADDETLRGYEVGVGGGRIDVRFRHHGVAKGLRVISETDTRLNQWSHVFVTYDGSSLGGGVEIYLNGEPQKTNIAEDDLKSTIRIDGTLKIGQGRKLPSLLGMVADVRIYNRVLTDAEVSHLAGRDPIPVLLAQKRRTDQQQQDLKIYFLEQYDSRYQALREEREECRATLRRLRGNLPTVMVMREMENPRDTFVLTRGQYDQHGEKVSVGTPAVLPPLPTGVPPNRLGLAMWLTDPAHPLLGRVTVNRFWQMAFGLGIVKTSEDFGVQGDRPSHPELLDYLATEFAQSGWNTKESIKRIFMSATYRQSSAISPEGFARDPENRLLARGPRYRLPAEMIRDSALAVSGLLVEKMGGASVKPYQPAGLWIEMGNRPYEQDKGKKLYRRSLYTYIKRSVPPPNMAAMDAPNREICMLRRQRTSTPLMALVMLNDPTYVEAARAFAQHLLLTGGPKMEDCIVLGFELAMSRRPNSVELAELLLLYKRQLAVYQEDGESAQKLLAVGESQRDPDLPVDRHAALTCVASVLLNLDETISKE